MIRPQENRLLLFSLSLASDKIDAYLIAFTPKLARPSQAIVERNRAVLNPGSEILTGLWPVFLRSNELRNLMLSEEQCG